MECVKLLKLESGGRRLAWMAPCLRPVIVAIVGWVGLSLLAACAPSHFDPVAWDPPAECGSVGALEQVQNLAPVTLLPTLDGHGPETLVAGEGWMYTGLKDGRILRFRPDGTGMEAFSDTGGRANGLAFDRDGNLIVADSYQGLLSIDPSGRVQVLATAADGQPFVFPDGLDIASDGTIWFTDASARFPDGQFHYDILEGRRSGRLLSYDPTTRETRVRVADLRFPNGIALGPEDQYVLVNEMLAYRTLRHWIEGPRAGETEIFADGYPGMPDDIRFNDAGLFWIALVADRISLLDWIQRYPRTKSFLGNALGWAVPDTDSSLLADPAAALALDTEGRVVHRWRDESSQFLGTTSVLEHEGQLFLGSISMAAVGVVPLR